MGPSMKQGSKRTIDKRFLSKNKTIKLYKEKQRKIEAYQKEVAHLTQQYEQLDSTTIEDFDDFPLSIRTRKGLRESKYVKPTEIQKESIGLALKGHDILGAAKTGSGKTLAFIIPIMEHLFTAGWSILDGLGAIIITPTRELAYQIFEVLNKVGSNHHFSAALVIGGKDLAKERKLLDKCNILICTPGRLQQHMDENPLFDAMNLKILVLDEADRILDLGFKESMNAILENLPQERQTLLFSATQTKSVKDLARLSLKNPMYVSVHEHAKHTTPESLQQSFLVCEAHEKMNMIWSFIKSHKKQKILVFMASCKQVKFMYESFCRLRPGVSVMAMYGSLHQLRRMAIYDEFCKKNHVVMFATDVASRGLDFPNVNWVVQLDCPEDVNTYIHRAGRTARFEKGGEALLVLLPSEKDSMVEQLEKRKIPIEEIKVNPSKLHSIQRKLEAICARDDCLKDSGSRAFKSYIKSLSKMKDKTVFDVSKIDFELYAKSLGLDFAPRVRFLERSLKEKLKTTSTAPTIVSKSSCGLFASSDESDDDGLQEKIKYPSVDSSDNSKRFAFVNESTQDIVGDDIDSPNTSKKPLTKAALAKRMMKKKVKPNTIIRFDEHGEPIRDVCGRQVPVVGADIQKELLEEGYSIEKAKLLKDKEDVVDRMVFKERIKSKHREERQKLKQKNIEKNPDGASAMLNKTKGDLQNESDASGSESEDIDPNTIGNFDSDMSGDDVEEHSESELDEEKGQADEVSEDNSEDSDEYPDPEIQTHSGNKRKRFNEKLKAKKKQIAQEQSRKKIKLGRTIEDDEQLALHFLSNT